MSWNYLNYRCTIVIDALAAFTAHASKFDRYGGTIAVRSQLGTGTTRKVCVFLPDWPLMKSGVYLLKYVTVWLFWIVVGLSVAQDVCAADQSMPTTLVKPSPTLVTATDEQQLSGVFHWLEDPARQLTASQAFAKFNAGQFAQVKTPTPSGNNFGMTDSAIWLAATLQLAEGAPPDRLLEVAYSPLDRVDLFLSAPDGSISHLASGDLLDFKDRPVLHRNHVFPVKLIPGEAVALMIRLESEGAVAAPVTLWKPLAFATHNQGEYAILGLYFGLLAGLLGYNLLLYFSIGDRVYLFYVGFVAWVAITEAALTGLGIQFAWTTLTWFNSILPPFGMAMASGFAIAFARVFLASRTLMPRTDITLQGLIAFCGLVCLAALAIPYSMALRMATVVTGVAAIALVWAGVQAVRFRHPGARIFFSAWVVLLLGVAVLGLHNNALVPSNLVTANALLVGSALAMLLLSFALADRIKQARADNELAQALNQAQLEMLEELRISQQQLQATSSEHEAMLNNALVGIVLSVARQHEWLNEKFAQMMGFTKEELIGRSSRYIHPDEESWERFGRVARACLMETGAYVTEWELQRRNGERFWVVMAGSCVDPRNPDSGVIWTFLDITERKQAEDDTRRALAQQQELNELRARFVSMTSHEFRTPLASIQSSQELLEHYASRISEGEKAELLSTIATAVQRMTHMLDRMLLIGKAQAQMLDFDPQMTDLVDLGNELVEEARRQYPHTSCNINLDIAPEARHGKFDPKLLRHIFGNLLSNAIKYSPEGGEIQFGARLAEGQTVFHVSDEGIGIPPSELPHLFESFHRASNVGAIAGTGLGLAIVKSSVDLHQGQISVESRPGQGTCFFVKI